ncbi:hypothetical protein [Actinospica robiniae]|uniref:carboxylate--amine ligase n=1 Tax=Actinospica robiniae TaxID=304901 RepID=UPI000414A138|nr:hypothetical protein [Actinospica robiniae]
MASEPGAPHRANPPRGPALDRARPALVVRVGRNPLLNHGALGAVRSLGRAGVPVYTLTEDRTAPVGLSRHLAGRFVWPATGAEDPARLAAGLRRIAERLESPVVALPTSDEAAVLLAGQREALRDLLLLPAVAPDLPARLVDKYAMHELCLAHDTPTPRALVADSAPALRQAVAELGLPVVVKNADLAGRLTGPVVGTTRKLAGPAQVEQLAEALETHGAKRLLVQEFVPPDRSSARRPPDWFAHVYCPQGEAEPLVFTGVKLRDWPPGAGVTARGVAVANPELAACAARFCRDIGYRGIGDMDWRFDPRDGRLKLVDFNPRLGAQAQVFRTTAGVDLVRALHLDLTGRPIPPGRQIDGRELVVEHLDAAAGYLLWRRRRAAGAPKPRPIPVHRRERAWFAWDDPLPFAVVTARFARNILVKTARRARARLRPAPG